MKKVLIFTIDVYQKIISSALKQLVGVNSACRFDVTCSDYAKESISKKGILVGSYLSIVRVLKCQPFYNAFGQAERNAKV